MGEKSGNSVAYQLSDWLLIRPDDVIVLVAACSSDAVAAVVLDARRPLVNVDDD